MDNKFVRSREAIMYARDALRRGDMTNARRWAEQAAALAPQSEDPWLVLAAVASPRESVEFIRQALQVNPNSSRGRRAMEWAIQRLGETPKARNNPENGQQVRIHAEAGILPSLSNIQHAPEEIESPHKPKKLSWLLPLLLVLLGCGVFAFAAYSAVTSPVLASMLRFANPSPVVQNHAQPFAEVSLAKPTYTAVPGYTAEAVALAPTVALPALRPTKQPTEIPPQPTFTLTEAPLIVDTTVPAFTETPGTMFAEIVPDTPTPEYVAVAPVSEAPLPVQGVDTGGVHWIDVDLSQQRVYAYAGDTIVNSFVVSTGTWQYPTVTGKYKVWIKLRYTDMAGPGYYLPDVPYTMYFYKGYALHGTYWHNNFGTPMSHGCVNLSIPDAQWLYDFSAVGTVVNVHY